jgi:hypothetical protein
MLPAEFERTIPTSERPQTHALDCVAPGIRAIFLQYAQYFLECKIKRGGCVKISFRFYDDE